MKITKFFAFAAMAASALSFGACSDDDDDDNDNNDTPKPEVKVESVTLSATTLSVEAGKTAVLTATLNPSGATGSVTWTTSDAAVATVDNGTVTGVKEGTATITASVGDVKGECRVTVGKTGADTPDVPELTGSDYYVFQLDETTYDANTSKIKLDLRVDDSSKFLYIWEGTYTGGTSTGKNFFGLAEGWVSVVVGNAGWSGLGLCYGKTNDDNGPEAKIDLSALYDVYVNADQYTFHIAMKSTDNASHCIIFYGKDSEVKYALGGEFVDNGVTIPSVGDFERDGEWHEIEIPASKLVEDGLIYPEAWSVTGQNIIAFLSGGKAGTTLDYDAMYFYKK